jgi:hypothetical protein
VRLKIRVSVVRFRRPDGKTLGRVHPATVIAILVTVPMHVLESWIASSDWWTLSPRLLGG